MTFKNISSLLLLIIFTFSNSYAQKQKELDKVLKDAFWTNCPKEFKLTQEPQIWKNESAVILANSYELIISKEVRPVKVVEIAKQTYHFRVKLNDKAAVEAYSILDFINNRSTNKLFGDTKSYLYYGIKIVKVDGIEKELDLKNIDNINPVDKKIAIPGLEEGDILDFFISVKNEYDASIFYHKDIVEMELLENNYPTVYRSIFFKFPGRYKVYHNSYNGAPKFTTTSNADGLEYKFVDTMRTKASDILGKYPHRTSPEIRYRFSAKNYSYYDYKEYNRYDYMDGLSYVEDFMDKRFNESTDTLQLLNELFLMLRSPIYMYQFSPGYPLYEPMNYMMVRKSLVLYISDYLSKKDISHDVIIVPRKSIGPFENLIDFSSCEYIVRVKKPKLAYFGIPIPFRLPNQIPYMLEGMEGSVNEHTFHLKYNKHSNEVIPVSKPEDNQTVLHMDMMLDEADLTKIKVKREFTVKGNNKEDHQYLIYTNYDYLKEYDQTKYEQNSSGKLKEVIEKFKKEQLNFEQRITQDYLKRDKKMVASIQIYMDVKVSDYKNLNIKSIGMWPESPTTQYSDEFTIEKLVKNSDANYIIDFGKIIGRQNIIKDEDRVRTVDIYINYPKSYDDEYTFTIPDGYSVEGLENFNKSSINETGGFISSAEIKDGKLIVKTREYFNANYYPVNKWEDLLKFLDTYMEFYNTKLLLRKN